MSATGFIDKDGACGGRDAALSVRIVTVDYSMEAPLSHMDHIAAAFSADKKPWRVPVIRVFGISADDGRKCCVHVHGVLPYLCVPCDLASEGADAVASAHAQSQQLAASLDRSLSVCARRADHSGAGGNGDPQLKPVGPAPRRSAAHVHGACVVRGTPFYGYHERQRLFHKIYLYNPAMISKAAELLQSGVLLHRSFQPHEAHVPYLLQFFIDFNLYGMNWLHLQTFTRRHSVAVDTRHQNGSVVAAVSTCQLELDALACHIANRRRPRSHASPHIDETSAASSQNLPQNPGLVDIWLEERQRQSHLAGAGVNEMCHAPLTMSQPPEPSMQPVIDDEARYLAVLREKVAQMVSQASASDSDIADAACDVACSQELLFPPASWFCLIDQWQPPTPDASQSAATLISSPMGSQSLDFGAAPCWSPSFSQPEPDVDEDLLSQLSQKSDTQPNIALSPHDTSLEVALMQLLDVDSQQQLLARQLSQTEQLQQVEDAADELEMSQPVWSQPRSNDQPCDVTDDGDMYGGATTRLDALSFTASSNMVTLVDHVTRPAARSHAQLSSLDGTVDDVPVAPSDSTLSGHTDSSSKTQPTIRNVHQASSAELNSICSNEAAGLSMKSRPSSDLSHSGGCADISTDGTASASMSTSSVSALNKESSSPESLPATTKDNNAATDSVSPDNIASESALSEKVLNSTGVCAVESQADSCASLHHEPHLGSSTIVSCLRAGSNEGSASLVPSSLAESNSLKEPTSRSSIACSANSAANDGASQNKCQLLQEASTGNDLDVATSTSCEPCADDSCALTDIADIVPSEQTSTVASGHVEDVDALHDSDRTPSDCRMLSDAIVVDEAGSADLMPADTVMNEMCVSIATSFNETVFDSAIVSEDNALSGQSMDNPINQMLRDIMSETESDRETESNQREAVGGVSINEKISSDKLCALTEEDGTRKSTVSIATSRASSESSQSLTESTGTTDVESSSSECSEFNSDCISDTSSETDNDSDSFSEEDTAVVEIGRNRAREADTRFERKRRFPTVVLKRLTRNQLAKYHIDDDLAHVVYKRKKAKVKYTPIISNSQAPLRIQRDPILERHSQSKCSDSSDIVLNNDTTARDEDERVHRKTPVSRTTSDDESIKSMDESSDFCPSSWDIPWSPGGCWLPEIPDTPICPLPILSGGLWAFLAGMVYHPPRCVPPELLLPVIISLEPVEEHTPWMQYKADCRYSFGELTRTIIRSSRRKLDLDPYLQGVPLPGTCSSTRDSGVATPQTGNMGTKPSVSMSGNCPNVGRGRARTTTLRTYSLSRQRFNGNVKQRSKPVLHYLSSSSSSSSASTKSRTKLVCVSSDDNWVPDTIDIVSSDSDSNWGVTVETSNINAPHSTASTPQTSAAASSSSSAMTTFATNVFNSSSVNSAGSCALAVVSVPGGSIPTGSSATSVSSSPVSSAFNQSSSRADAQGRTFYLGSIDSLAGSRYEISARLIASSGHSPVVQSVSQATSSTPVSSVSTSTLSLATLPPVNNYASTMPPNCVDVCTVTSNVSCAITNSYRDINNHSLAYPSIGLTTSTPTVSNSGSFICRSNNNLLRYALSTPNHVANSTSHSPIVQSSFSNRSQLSCVPFVSSVSSDTSLAQNNSAFRTSYASGTASVSSGALASVVMPSTPRGGIGHATNGLVGATWCLLPISTAFVQHSTTATSSQATLRCFPVQPVSVASAMPPGGTLTIRWPAAHPTTSPTSQSYVRLSVPVPYQFPIAAALPLSQQPGVRIDLVHAETLADPVAVSAAVCSSTAVRSPIGAAGTEEMTVESSRASDGVLHVESHQPGVIDLNVDQSSPLVDICATNDRQQIASRSVVARTQTVCSGSSADSTPSQPAHFAAVSTKGSCQGVASSLRQGTDVLSLTTAEIISPHQLVEQIGSPSLDDARFSLSLGDVEDRSDDEDIQVLEVRAPGSNARRKRSALALDSPESCNIAERKPIIGVTCSEENSFRSLAAGENESDISSSRAKQVAPRIRVVIPLSSNPSDISRNFDITQNGDMCAADIRTPDNTCAAPPTKCPKLAPTDCQHATDVPMSDELSSLSRGQLLRRIRHQIVIPQDVASVPERGPDAPVTGSGSVLSALRSFRLNKSRTASECVSVAPSGTSHYLGQDSRRDPPMHRACTLSQAAAAETVGAGCMLPRFQTRLSEEKHVVNSQCHPSRSVVGSSVRLAHEDSSARQNTGRLLIDSMSHITLPFDSGGDTRRSHSSAAVPNSGGQSSTRFDCTTVSASMSDCLSSSWNSGNISEPSATDHSSTDHSLLARMLTGPDDLSRSTRLFKFGQPSTRAVANSSPQSHATPAGDFKPASLANSSWARGFPGASRLPGQLDGADDACPLVSAVSSSLTSTTTGATTVDNTTQRASDAASVFSFYLDHEETLPLVSTTQSTLKSTAAVADDEVALNAGVSTSNGCARAHRVEFSRPPSPCDVAATFDDSSSESCGDAMLHFGASGLRHWRAVSLACRAPADIGGADDSGRQLQVAMAALDTPTASQRFWARRRRVITPLVLPPSGQQVKQWLETRLRRRQVMLAGTRKRRCDGDATSGRSDTVVAAAKCSRMECGDVRESTEELNHYSVVECNAETDSSRGINDDLDVDRSSDSCGNSSDSSGASCDTQQDDSASCEDNTPRSAHKNSAVVHSQHASGGVILSAPFSRPIVKIVPDGGHTPTSRRSGSRSVRLRLQRRRERLRTSGVVADGVDASNTVTGLSSPTDVCRGVSGRQTSTPRVGSGLAPSPAAAIDSADSPLDPTSGLTAGTAPSVLGETSLQTPDWTVCGFGLPSQVTSSDQPQHQHQMLTSLSVEVLTESRKCLTPDPRHDAITAVFYALDNDIPERMCTVHRPKSQSGCIIVDYGTTWQYSGHECGDVTTDNWLMCRVADEMALLSSLVQLVRTWDPDILIGWETERASWGYILERAAVLRQHLVSALSRVPNQHAGSPTHPADVSGDVTSDVTASEARKDDVTYRAPVDWAGHLKITGRVVLNLWRVIKDELSLYSYSLENVVFHVLHRRVPHYHTSILAQWWSANSPVLRWRVVEYFRQRCRATLMVLDKLDLIGRTSELARIFGIQFYDVLTRGTQFRVESMMLRLARPRELVPVTPSVQQRSTARAPECIPLVLEPESKMYTDPVVVLDFQSLYPSIIIAYNYCFSTCLGRVDNLLQAGGGPFGCTWLHVAPRVLSSLLSADCVHVAPCGVAFVDERRRRRRLWRHSGDNDRLSISSSGLLPDMLHEILQTRVMVKSAMKCVQPDSAVWRQLNFKQLGLKLIANVTYGYTSANFSGRMPCIEVGDSVVSKAREILQRAIRLIERHATWNARVVYGDTDSLFVLLKGRTRDDAFRLGAEMVAAVTADNRPPIKLKFEKVYQPCILQTKKRYVGYMYESAQQTDAVFDAKGIETVRRDSCPATAKILQRALRVLFDTRSMRAVRACVSRQLGRLQRGLVSPVHLTFAREYRGRRGYKPGARVPALAIADRIAATDSRGEPLRGDRVPYVIVYDAPGLPLIRLVRCARRILTHVDGSDGCGEPPLNYDYYASRAIVPALHRCLALVDATACPDIHRTPGGSDPLLWWRSLARPVATRTVAKNTLSAFLSTAVCCVCGRVCGSGDGVCERCRSRPQAVVAYSVTAARQAGRRLSHLRQICADCCGCDRAFGGDSDRCDPLAAVTPCVNHECPLRWQAQSTVFHHQRAHQTLESVLQAI